MECQNPFLGYFDAYFLPVNRISFPEPFGPSALLAKYDYHWATADLAIVVDLGRQFILRWDCNLK
jgi:hypothetical protein